MLNPSLSLEESVCALYLSSLHCLGLKYLFLSRQMLWCILAHSGVKSLSFYHFTCRPLKQKLQKIVDVIWQGNKFLFEFLFIEKVWFHCLTGSNQSTWNDYISVSLKNIMPHHAFDAMHLTHHSTTRNTLITLSRPLTPFSSSGFCETCISWTRFHPVWVHFQHGNPAMVDIDFALTPRVDKRVYKSLEIEKFNTNIFSRRYIGLSLVGSFPVLLAFNII